MKNLVDFKKSEKELSREELVALTGGGSTYRLYIIDGVVIVVEVLDDD